jgi:acyl-CoA hydrolase
MPKREIKFCFLAEPTDVNFGGKVHGGAVMKWIDQASYACASAWSGEYSITVYVGGIRFLAPIKIGDLVEIDAKIIYTGTTSMHIAVDVYATPVKSANKIKTTHCIIVFVAVDAENKPIKVPAWVPNTKADKELETYAIRLMERRKEIEDTMRPFIEN